MTARPLFSTIEDIRRQPCTVSELPSIRFCFPAPTEYYVVMLPNANSYLGIDDVITGDLDSARAFTFLADAQNAARGISGATILTFSRDNEENVDPFDVTTN